MCIRDSWYCVFTNRDSDYIPLDRLLDEEIPQFNVRDSRAVDPIYGEDQIRGMADAQRYMVEARANSQSLYTRYLHFSRRQAPS